MKTYLTNRFEILSEWISAGLGSAYAFMAAFLVVALWAVTGPLFDYSDTWQLIINTGTTISTFLMVFLLQNTGNRTIEEMQDNLCRVERQNAGLMQELLALRQDLRGLHQTAP